MEPDTHNTPVEPQIGEDQYIDADGNVRTDNINDKTRRQLRNGGNPFPEL